jgi:hypothetical protein
VQLRELGDREGGLLEGGHEGAGEGPIGTGDRRAPLAQRTPRVLVAQEGRAGEAVQGDRIGRLLADPFDGEQLAAQGLSSVI